MELRLPAHFAMVVDGRRQFHTPAFLQHESRFEHYEQARAWERKNLDRILSF